MTTHTDIVASARGWIGTRFHHQGRVKKNDSHRGGVDCLGLLAGVAEELNLCAPDGTKLSRLDETDYSHYPDTMRLKLALEAVLSGIRPEEIAPGDVVLLRIDGQPQHLAIVSDHGQGLGIIHAYAPARAVVEHALDAWWCNHIEAAYRLPNITN